MRGHDFNQFASPVIDEYAHTLELKLINALLLAKVLSIQVQKR